MLLGLTVSDNSRMSPPLGCVMNIKVLFPHRHYLARPCCDCRRNRTASESPSWQDQLETRVYKARNVLSQPVDPNVFLEAFHAGGIFLPLTGLGSGSTVVQVVINAHRRRVRRNRCLCSRHEAAASRIDDVVLERIVVQVALHLELPYPVPAISFS